MIGCGGNVKVIPVGEIYEASSGEDWPLPQARIM
jgi:hypothetical protein